MVYSPEKYIELEKDLNESYKDFFHFSLDLAKNIEKDNNNLKFAVVNMQIALELFLKYYFLRKGKYEWLFSNKSKLTFNDFSSILDKFFSKDNDLLVTKKNHLKKILEARNKIVHEGKSNWSEDLATNLINTTLFIQNVLNREFQETLINTSYGDNDLASNLIWREGTQNFASNIASLNGKEVYECWFCYSRSFIDKKIFSCDEYDDEGFQCVTCFNSFYLHDQIELAKCICDNETFIIDSLNPQEKGNKYNGKCLRCDFSYWAYRCDSCSKYFIDIDEVNMVRIDEQIFCSRKCFDKYKMKKEKNCT